MSALVIGCVLGLVLGAICRACDIPSPAPPTPIGALLVVAMTSGYVVAGMV